jgi:peptidoglycan/LPS O-acetylase OafA/YrhL
MHAEALKNRRGLPNTSLMARLPAPALAAFALLAAVACAVATFAADRLGVGPLAGGLLAGVIALGCGACALAVAHRARQRSAREPRSSRS